MENKKKKIIITACLCILLVISVACGAKIKKKNSHISNVENNSTKVSERNNGSERVGDRQSSDSNDDKRGDSYSEEKKSSLPAESTEKEPVKKSYIGSSKGFRGDVKLKVDMDGEKISNIEILETKDDEAYFSKAKELINEIIDKQSADVEVVSGATYSSNGIIGAVKDALSKGGK